jgi:hypothetical protein
MVLLGLLLVSGLLLIGVEAPGYVRDRYNSAFWRLPLDDKLDHVFGNRFWWWWISIWSLVGLFLMTGGVSGLAFLLADAGEPALAFAAYGGYLVALLAWVFGLIVQAAAVSVAAAQRAETGETPAWIHPLWNAAYVTEIVWIVGANIAYVLFGLAVVSTGLVAAWAGWAAIIGGALIPVVVVVMRDGFPQLALFAPAIIGVALILEIT